jgi:hypothetical protein
MKEYLHKVIQPQNDGILGPACSKSQAFSIVTVLSFMTTSWSISNLPSKPMIYFVNISKIGNYIIIIFYYKIFIRIYLVYRGGICSDNSN